jgi:alkanesulfonate monooxygenase SsuD/methylene tetrahydromethanopterin reductase-like flavin-dependent oxidoreductase (luciferase family)
MAPKMQFHFFHLMPWPYLPEDFEQKHESAWVTAPNSLFDPQRGAKLYQRYIDELVYADELGFDGIVINEHHFNAYGLMASPNLIAAALSQRTRQARMIVLGNALPMYGNPIRVAEEYAMLDLLFQGRFSAGFVVGGGPEWYSYNLNPTQARGMWREAHDLIVRAWTEDGPFSYEGKHYQFQYVNPWPKPFQKPHPPIWVPGTGSLETIQFVAERGYTYAAVTYANVAAFRQNATTLQEAWAKTGKAWEPDKLGWLVPVYVAETDEQARKEAEPHIWYFALKLLKGLGYSGTGITWMPPGYTSENSMLRVLSQRMSRRDQLTLAQDWSDVEAGGNILVGSVETVTQKLVAYAKEFQHGHYLCLLHFGSLPADLTRKNMELMARKVIPAVRRALGAEAPSPVQSAPASRAR